MNKLPNKMIVFLIFVVFLVGAIISAYMIFKPENQPAVSVDQKQKLSELVTNPVQLLTAAQQVDQPPEAVSKMEYRQSEYVDRMAEQLLDVVEGRSLPDEIDAVNQGDEAAKQRNSVVLGLLGQSWFSRNISTELEIIDKPEFQNSYFFTSTDISTQNIKSEQTLNTHIATQLNKLCQDKGVDCLTAFGSKAKTKGNVLVTYYPQKISDDPLIYRVYSLLRLYSLK